MQEHEFTWFIVIASKKPLLPDSSSPSIKKITFTSKRPTFSSSCTANAVVTIGPYK